MLDAAVRGIIPLWMQRDHGYKDATLCAESVPAVVMRTFLSARLGHQRATSRARSTLPNGVVSAPSITPGRVTR